MEETEEMGKVEFVPGVSVDIGTMFVVSARKTGSNKISTVKVRDAFIDLPPEHKRMLKLAKTSYIELDGKLLVLGDEALDTANLFSREARRPLSNGFISSGEIDAQQVLGLILKKVLGEPLAEKEKCYFSVPALAVDTVDSDLTYHKAILAKLIEELGFDPQPHNEAHAIIFSECAKENFSGIGISYGSGMTNVCLSFNAMNALEFSLAKFGGDWIDRGAAKAVNTTAAKICALKESGVNINEPSTREAEAIALYIQTLIDQTIENFVDHFAKVKSKVQVPRPVPIVVSGGTSLANGFMEKFQERFERHRKNFPLEISDIRHAKDPMTAVSTGLLLLAQMDD